MSLNDNTNKIAAILAAANALPDKVLDGVVLDATLTQSGKAADAKAVGDALAEKQSKGNYLTQDNLQSATDAALAQAKASGEFDGEDGKTPYIGDNGNWYIGADDTGKPSRGAKGEPGEGGAGAYYVELDGDYPHYTLSETTPLADIAAAYNDGKALFCRYTRSGQTVTLPLFMWNPESNKWVFSASGSSKIAGVPVQCPSIHILSSDGVFMSETELVTTKEDLPRGKSAYEIAKENGFNGTEAEWLASLKGEPGAAGAPGQPGADGKSAYQYAQDGGYTGTETEFAEKLAQEIPSALPNPNALTFTGAVTGTYNGSAPLTVKIPSAVTDDHINNLIDTKLGVIENGTY